MSSSGAEKKSGKKAAQLNPALKRTLEAFFDDESQIPQELRTQLPEEGRGLSLQRARLIKQSVEGEGMSRFEALSALERQFGMPEDPALLAIALTHPQQSIQHRALRLLSECALDDLDGGDREQLNGALRRFELHCFDERLLKQSRALRSQLL
ncbi:MAG: hypothetical protein VYD19_02455 [Myxococcota bacterium]|nr:hypothetical protein [Myxococcota bacterium]